MSGVDPNVWYLVSEGRVDKEGQNFNSCLQDVNDKGDLQVNARTDQHWQFQPVDGGVEGRFHLRTDRKGPDEQLSACFKSDEVHPLRTGICMQPSSLSEAQQWDLVRWDGNDELAGFKLINVDNGTDIWLDVHPGNPPFMSNNIDESVPQPAQHWFLQSAKEVNDGAYSTVYDIATPTSGTFPTSVGSGSGPGSTGDQGNDSSNGLSAGAMAGIGIGVGLAVLSLGLGAFYMFKRRRKNKMWAQEEKASQVANSQGGHPHSHYPAGQQYPPLGQGYSQSPERYVSPVYSGTPPTEADDGKPALVHEAPSTGRRRVELP